MTGLRPLVVDLDGTLLPVDTLHESLGGLIRRPTRAVPAFALALRGRRAELKRMLAESMPLDVEQLPVRAEVLEYVDRARAEGRRVYLASAADRSIVDAVALRFGPFDGVIGSDGAANLSGARKAAAIRELLGTHEYDYVGDAPVDIAVWEAAAGSVLVAEVDPGETLPRWARGRPFDDVIRVGRPRRLRLWAKQLRVHQVLKNVLVFLPMIAAHDITDPLQWARGALGFLAFSLTAMAIYGVNDLVDVNADRQHSRKRNRPLAAGRVSPIAVALVSGVLLIAGLLLSFLLDPAFALVVAVYAALSLTYSFALKRMVLVDVIALAMLYMIRILGGAVLASVTLSFWFTGVTLFLFLSLALVKRYSELLESGGRSKTHRVPGRGYVVRDAPIVLALGVATGMSSILLMGTYIQSDAISLLYPIPTVLWLVIPLYFYWLGNMWIVAVRGGLQQDPVLFAVRNPASLISGALMALVFVVASAPLS